MKNLYQTPMVEVATIEVERGFTLSQQTPSEWEDM